MVKDRENFIRSVEKINPFHTIIAENYYEIIKELCVALALIEGVKFIGESAHKELITHTRKYDEIFDRDREIIQDLRIRRNKSSYEGKPFDEIYFVNHKNKILEIISKFRLLVESRV